MRSELDPGLTRAILALALRASFAVRAHSSARRRRDDEQKDATMSGNVDDTL
jgi:hypothetical protein